MSTRPQIFNTYANLEADLVARLEAAGDVRPVAAGARADVLRQLAPAHGLFGHVAVDAELLDAAPDLKVVATVSVGYDRIDVTAATARGVAVCNTPGVLTGAVADVTTVLIIMLARRILENEAFARSGAWGRRERLPGLGVDIAGKTLGVVGFGRIGREVARRMQALGMRPTWYDIFDQLPAGAPDVPYRPLDQLLRESHFVSVHMDLNDSSRKLIGARELGLMRGDAYLINTARGGAVDQAALTDALRSGSIAGAGLDVVDPEPPAEDEPLVTLPNAIVLPHMASATHETRRAMRELAVDNVVDVLAGRRPRAIVNPEVLE